MTANYDMNEENLDISVARHGSNFVMNGGQMIRGRVPQKNIFHAGQA